MNSSSNSVANKCLFITICTVQEKDFSIAVVYRLYDCIIYPSLCTIELGSVNCDSGNYLCPVIIQLLINEPVTLFYYTLILYNLWHA